MSQRFVRRLIDSPTGWRWWRISVLVTMLGNVSVLVRSIVVGQGLLAVLLAALLVGLAGVWYLLAQARKLAANPRPDRSLH